MNDRHGAPASTELVDTLADQAQFDRRLGTSLHHGRTARAVVRLVVPALADVAVIVLPPHARHASWYRADTWDGERSGYLSVETVRRVLPVANALSGLQPRAAVLSARELEALAVAMPRHLDGHRQALVLELSGHGIPAGALLLVRGPGRPEFDGREIDLASRFADRAGPALATAALYSEQAYTSGVLREYLAPERLPRADGVGLGATYRPAAETLQISGDFYHVAPRVDGGVTFFFGDVCGKGAEAAVVAGLVAQSLRALALVEPDPLRELRHLNRLMLDRDSRFATVLTGSARPSRDGGLTVVTAGGGHMPPLLLRRDGRAEWVELAGTAVGMLSSPAFDQAVSTLRPGEVMLLYSDGVTEACGGPAGDEPYGDDRLARALTTCLGMPAGAATERMEILTMQWLAGRPHDDIAMLALQAPPRQAWRSSR
jgi:hypothetical protein